MDPEPMLERPEELGAASEAGDRQLADALEEYLAEVERGLTPDVEALLARHAPIAHRLREAIDGLRFVSDAALSMREKHGVVDDGTLAERREIGEFRVLREIGRGGMGLVYEAEQLSLGRKVALKVLPFAAVLDEKQVRRFKNEAQAAAQLHHTNIVPVYSVGCDRGVHYYAMQLIEGRSLSDVLAELRERGQSDAEAREWHQALARLGIQAAEALSYAHDSGIVHRDVKPSNLLLDADGRLWVTDFGLARAHGIGSLTMSGNVLGTLRYMSPEQAAGRNASVDERSDVHGLGATLYELATLHPPVDGECREEILRKIAIDEPIAPRRHCRSLPRDLETIILKALARSPADRYSSARELARDLARFVEERPIAARRPGLVKKCAMWVRRHKAMAGATTVVSILMLSLAGLFIDRSMDARWVTYNGLINEGIARLEFGFLTAPGEELEGESVGVGLVYADDLERFGFDHFHDVVEIAADRLRAARDAWPWRPEAHFHLSRALKLLRRDEQSRQALDESLSVDPGFLPALAYRAIELRRHGDRAAADTEIQRIEALTHPGSQQWQDLWFHAFSAAERHEWTVLASLNTALLAACGEREPYVGFATELRLQRGRALVKLNRYQAAVEDFAVVEASWPRVMGPALIHATTYRLMSAPEEAQRVLQNALERCGASTENLLSAAGVHVGFGDKDRARAVIDGIPEEAIRLAYTALHLSRLDRIDEALPLAERAFALRAPVPKLYSFLGKEYAARGRGDEARAALRAGHDLFPDNTRILSELGWNAYFECRARDAVAIYKKALEIDPGSPWAWSGLGWSNGRLGQLAEGEACFTRAIESYPRHHFAYWGRGLGRRYAGDIPGAILDWIQCLLLEPGHSDALRSLLCLWTPANEPSYAPHWGDLLRAFEGALQRGLDTSHTRSLLALASLHSPSPSPERAREHASAGIELSQGRDPIVIATLGEVLLAAGSVPEGIRTLEKAVSMPGCLRGAVDRLDAARRQRFPRLATCASVDAFLSSQAAATDLQPVRDALTQTVNLESARYLSALLLEREGQPAAAYRDLEALVAAGNAEPAAALSLARLLGRLGRPAEGLDHLERLLLGAESECLEVWCAWMCLASDGIWPGRDPAPPEKLGPLGKEALAVLATLRRGDTLRINCGGKQVTDHNGALWSADQFCEGGTPETVFHPPLIGSSDREIFQSIQRLRSDFFARPRYRIPLPNGEYEISLHFVNTVEGPFPCSFDVSLEGREVLTGYSPGDVGVVDSRRFSISVDGGGLEIELRSRTRAFPQIAGIEVRRSR